jgi:PAS domain S-box-containing protein
LLYLKYYFPGQTGCKEIIMGKDDTRTKEELLKELQDTRKQLAKIKDDYKRVDELVHQSILNWEDTFDNITDMITIHDNDFNIIYANRAAEKILNLPFMKDVKSKCYKFYHGKEAPPEGCPSCACLRTGKPDSFEIFEPHLDRFIEIRAMPQFDSNKKLIGLIHIVRDITERKKMEEEIQKYRANLEAIFRNINDAIISVDNSLTVLEVNRAAEDICGFSRDIIGKNFRALSFGYSAECIKVLEDVLEKREPVEVYRLECRAKGCEGKVVSLAASPLLNDQGVFEGAVLVVKDETRLAVLEEDLKERQQLHNIIGTSEKMQGIFSLIETLADVETTVLITGESGTGKEMVTEALHYKGSRRGKPLVKVNCSALSENLLESELFGHVKGAFTGAIKDKAGRFEKAEGGTIFLDEIADISPGIQAKLLRVLQEKEFERVGDSTPVKADVRLIAATNQDLYKKVKDGSFREDLFFRLKVMVLNLPPLRERKEDIPLLVGHFIKKFNKKFSRDIRAVSENVERIFMVYPWPGNVRELEHALEHAFILCHQPVISIEHLPDDLKNYKSSGAASLKESEANAPELVFQALQKTDWNKAKAARMLGISRRTIYRKIEEFNISKKGATNM